MADAGRNETDALLAKMEKEVAAVYSRAEKESREKLNDFLKQFDAEDKVMKAKLDAGKITEAQYKAWRKDRMLAQKQFKEMLNSLTEDCVNADKIAMSIVRGYMPDVYTINRNFAAFEVEKGSMLDTSFTLYDRQTVERLIKDKEILLPKPRVDIPKDRRWNRQHIRNEITQGILQGESIPNIAKRLKNVFGMDHAAAVRNARTATTGAENLGRIDSYKRAQEMGIDLKQEWMAALDSRTRFSHRDLDGERVNVGARFSNGLRYPGDPDGDPEEVYNCRCTIVAFLTGFDFTDAPRKEALGGMSYEEWKNEKRQEQNPVEYHAKENFNKKAYDSLTPAQKADIANYTVGDYKAVNNILRGYDDGIINTLIDAANKGMVTTPEARTIATLDSFLEKNTLKSDAMLYRGLGHPSSLAKAMGIQLEQLDEMVSNGSIVGQRFMEKAFCSTSVLKESAFDSLVKLEVLAPKGTKGMYIGPISSYTKKAENEFLLQRKTIFEVVGVETKYHKDLDLTEYILKVKIVGQG